MFKSGGGADQVITQAILKVRSFCERVSSERAGEGMGGEGG